MAKHWTQTRAGRKRLSELQKARWARSRNGAAPTQELDAFEIMAQTLELYAKLPPAEKNYVRQRISP